MMLGMKLTWIAGGFVIVLMLGAGAVIAYQNVQLRDQVSQSTATVAAQGEQLKTASVEIRTMTEQLRQLSGINRQLVARFGEQQKRLDAISRNATAQAVKLEAITHEDQNARAWGDTPLPDAVARLLDNTTETGNSTGASAAGADQPASGVRSGDQRTKN